MQIGQQPTTKPFAGANDYVKSEERVKDILSLRAIVNFRTVNHNKQYHYCNRKYPHFDGCDDDDDDDDADEGEDQPILSSWTIHTTMLTSPERKKVHRD